MKLIKTARKIQLGMNRALSWVIAALAVVMSLCIFWQVICRYVLAMSNNWTEELARYCSVSMIFLGAILLLADKAHINIDILISLIKNEKAVKVVFLLVDIASLFILIPLAKWSFEYVAAVAALGTVTTALHIPYWIPISTLFLSMAMSLFYVAVDLMQGIYALLTGDLEKAEIESEAR